MNADEATRCADMAETEIKNGNYDKAHRLLQKSMKMEPTDRARELLRECDRLSGRGDPGSKDTAPPEEKKDYTDEDARIAADVMGKTDYYEILGVAKTAAEDEMKRQYKKLALKLHPDKNRAPQATDAFKKLTQAFSCLSDKNKRKAYDERGSEEGFRRQYQQQFREDDDMDPEDIFDLLFNGRVNPNRRRRHMYRDGNVYYYTERRANGEGQPQNVGRYGRLAQLLPLLLVLLLALIMQFKGFSGWNGQREYAFTRTSTFNNARTSERGGVRYFVGDAFAEKYTAEKLVPFEDEVDKDYMEQMWRQCSYAKWLKTNLEERKYYARERDKVRYDQEIRNIDVSSCDNYVRVKNSRSH